MRFGEYGFATVFDTKAELPPFKGSTLRGVFGVALKRVTCALRHQECRQCLLRSGCVYAKVFERDGGNRGGSQAPHPFVLVPALNTDTVFQPGDAFDCRLLLFGWANELLPYFVYAFEQVGRIGIGRAVAGRRGRFTLAEVTCGNRSLYDSRDRRLSEGNTTDLTLESFAAPSQPVGRVTLALETPLRVKFRNRFADELPFHLLVRAMMRRVSLLSEHFGDGKPALDYPGLVARAEAITTADSKLRWIEWRRYSNRQDRDMLLGGLMGTITYEGNLNEFIPLIHFCQKVHVGKATTFGLGKLRVVEMN